MGHVGADPKPTKDRRFVPRSRKKQEKPAFFGRGQRDRRRQGPASDRILLYGLHPVEAALANPAREIVRALVTENAAQRLEGAFRARKLKPELVLPRVLDRMLPADAVHQGLILEVAPLPPLEIRDIAPEGCLVVLDQVTDPHNVGAVLRSAAAFGAKGLVMPERHSPPLTGVLAKSASGALDVVPVILAGNLARALTEIGELGFARLGFAEEATATLEETSISLPLAIVLGAEGKGLRQLTRETCDQLCRISTPGPLASLNVSNAAAIALHWVATKARQ